MARAAASVLLQQGLSSQQGLASRRGSARDHALLKAKPKFGQSFVGPTWVSSRDLTSSGRGGGWGTRRGGLEWEVPRHGAVSLALSAGHLDVLVALLEPDAPEAALHANAHDGASASPQVLVALLEHEHHPVIFTFTQASGPRRASDECP